MVEQLVRLAEIWCEANGRSKSRLATIVINRGHFFDSDIDAMSRSGIATFERFLSFFRDGGNWAGGVIPAAAVDLLDNFENIATEAAASTGQIGEASREGDAAAPAACAQDEAA